MNPEQPELAPNTCPHCGEVQDSAKSATGKRKPSEGNLSLCAYCGSLALFGSDLSLRKPTKEETKEIMGGPSGPIIREAQILIAGTSPTPPSQRTDV